MHPPVAQQLSHVQPQHSTTRLERILELVTEHERVYREQDIRLADLVQKVTDLQVQHTGEWAALSPLKERNVAMELDLARAAVETVVRQLATVTKTNQALQAELRSCQQKQAAQQLSYESTVALMQADIAALRSRLDTVQANTQTSLDQVRSSVRLQAEQHRAEGEEQLQSTQRELESKLTRAVQDVSTQAAASVRELDGWTKQEMLQMAAKLKAVVQSCSNHQQQVNLQMEALQQQWDNTSASIEALQQEDRRIKKHISRLQQQTEELQQASQASAGNTAALQEVQQELAALSQAQHELQALQDACSSSANSTGRKLQEVGQQVQQLDVALAGQAADVAGLAESVLRCLAAAREQAAAAAEAAAQAPSSYLSTLLGPAMVPPAVPTVSSSKQMPWRAWDDQLAHVDGLVERLKRQQRAKQLSTGMTQGMHPGSPARQPLQARSAYSSASSPVKAGMLCR